MSRNIIFVLMYHRHKLLDFININSYNFNFLSNGYLCKQEMHFVGLHNERFTFEGYTRRMQLQLSALKFV
jgi:hypothetical protein